MQARLVRWALTGVALAFLAVCLVLPLVAVFAEALAEGLRAYWASISEPEALRALWLTAVVAVLSVPLNMAFGIAAAWAIARFQFPGRQLLVTLIDLPFAVSPVISGLIFVLLFGAQGLLGPWLDAHDITIIFAVPGIVLASVAYDAGIVNATFYTTLVLLAVLTSQAAGAWLDYVLRKGWPLLSGAVEQPADRPPVAD